MIGRIEARLRDLGIELPGAGAPVANYLPFTRYRGLLFIAGQLPRCDGEIRFAGTLGRDLSVEDGRKAARLCALNVLAHLRAALEGDLDGVRRCVRVGGFVDSAPGFTDHPRVIDGASDLIVEVFGDAGRHARTAVGVSALPLRSAVEVEAIFEVAAGRRRAGGGRRS
jgi:enamine deaminase RidA (YjgF/YER057c/UK114 family)